MKKTNSYATLFLKIVQCPKMVYCRLCLPALYVLGLLSRVSFVLLAVISWERYSAVRYINQYIFPTILS